MYNVLCTQYGGYGRYPSDQVNLIKMRAEFAYLNDCAVPFLRRTAVNLCWYYYAYSSIGYYTSHKNKYRKKWSRAYSYSYQSPRSASYILWQEFLWRLWLFNQQMNAVSFIRRLIYISNSFLNADSWNK